MAHEANRSYRDVLRDRHVAGLLLGDLLANAGTGMIIVAMPLQTLAIHGRLPKAIAVGLVEAAPFVLSTMLALAIGLGRMRVPPRRLLIADCVLRSLSFAALGILAINGQLTLPILIAGLLFGAAFRLAGSSSRRLLATSMAGDSGRFAVNGLLGLNATFALYIVGPVLGGVIVASTSAGVALFFDSFGAVILLAAVLSFLQSGLEPDEQQQVVTLWTTGSMVAAPLGLLLGGPLIEWAGTTGGLALSGGLTLLLLPIAALAVLRRAPASVMSFH